MKPAPTHGSHIATRKAEGKPRSNGFRSGRRARRNTQSEADSAASLIFASPPSHFSCFAVPPAEFPLPSHFSPFLPSLPSKLGCLSHPSMCAAPPPPGRNDPTWCFFPGYAPQSLTLFAGPGAPSLAQRSVTRATGPRQAEAVHSFSRCGSKTEAQAGEPASCLRSSSGTCEAMSEGGVSVSLDLARDRELAQIADACEVMGRQERHLSRAAFRSDTAPKHLNRRWGRHSEGYRDGVPSACGARLLFNADEAPDPFQPEGSRGYGERRQAGHSPTCFPPYSVRGGEKRETMHCVVASRGAPEHGKRQHRATSVPGDGRSSSLEERLVTIPVGPTLEVAKSGDAEHSPHLFVSEEIKRNSSSSSSSGVSPHRMCSSHPSDPSPVDVTLALESIARRARSCPSSPVSLKLSALFISTASSLSPTATQRPSSSSQCSPPPSSSSLSTEGADGDEAFRPLRLQSRSGSPPVAPEEGSWHYRRCPNPVSWLSRQINSTLRVSRVSELDKSQRKEGHSLSPHASFPRSGSSTSRPAKAKVNGCESPKQPVARFTKNWVVPPSLFCKTSCSLSAEGLCPPCCSVASSASGCLDSSVAIPFSLSSSVGASQSTAVGRLVVSSLLAEGAPRTRGNGMQQESETGNPGGSADGLSSPSEIISDSPRSPSEHDTNAHFFRHESHFSSLFLEAKSGPRAEPSVPIEDGSQCGTEKECRQLGFLDLPGRMNPDSPCVCAACGSRPFSNFKRNEAQASDREQTGRKDAKQLEQEVRRDSAHCAKQEGTNGARATVLKRTPPRLCCSLTNSVPAQAYAGDVFIHEQMENVDVTFKTSHESAGASPCVWQQRENEAENTRRRPSLVYPSQRPLAETKGEGKCLPSLSNAQKKRDTLDNPVRNSEEKAERENEEREKVSGIDSAEWVLERNSFTHGREEAHKREGRHWKEEGQRQEKGRRKCPDFLSRGSERYRDEEKEGNSVSSRRFLPGRLRPKTKWKAFSSSSPRPALSSLPSAGPFLPSALPPYSCLLPFSHPSFCPSARVSPCSPSGVSSPLHQSASREGVRDVGCQFFLSVTLPLPCTLLPEDVAASVERVERKEDRTGEDGVSKHVATPDLPSLATFVAGEPSSFLRTQGQREQEGPAEDAGTDTEQSGKFLGEIGRAQEKQVEEQSQEEGEGEREAGECEAEKEQKHERRKEWSGTTGETRDEREPLRGRKNPKNREEQGNASAFSCPRLQQNGAVVMVQALYDLSQEHLLLPAYHVYDKSGVFQGLLPFAAFMKTQSRSCFNSMPGANGHMKQERANQEGREKSAGRHPKNKAPGPADQCSDSIEVPPKDRRRQERASFTGIGTECRVSRSGRKKRIAEQNEREESNEAFFQQTIVTPLPVLSLRQLESLHSAVARMYGSEASNKGLLCAPRKQLLSYSSPLLCSSPSISSPGPVCSPRGCSARMSSAYAAPFQWPLLSCTSSDSYSSPRFSCSSSPPDSASVAAGHFRVRLGAGENGGGGLQLVGRQEVVAAVRGGTGECTKKDRHEAEERRRFDGETVEVEKDAQRPVGSGRMRKRRRRRKESRAGECADSAENARACTEGQSEKAEKDAEESNGPPHPKRAELKALRGVFAALCYMASALRHEPEKDEKCKSDSASPSLLDSTQSTSTISGPIENIA
ncbi:hypothetical protein TGCAST_319320 [Toxoplasma gondii CAST]|uniref:Uncharacterized protein n=1 Tax=Toxoplasma gondii CAST TaxID=943122 RepID=A0A425HNT9_TOXGO|nr:hypothetical protein TGCAST_319320 [Toxoplasma gondii CAST]